MGYFNNAQIANLDARTSDDDMLDKRDGLASRVTTNRARFQAALKRIAERDPRARPLPMDEHHEGEAIG